MKKGKDVLEARCGLFGGEGKGSFGGKGRREAIKGKKKKERRRIKPRKKFSHSSKRLDPQPEKSIGGEKKILYDASGREKLRIGPSESSRKRGIFLGRGKRIIRKKERNRKAKGGSPIMEKEFSFADPAI